MSSSEDFRRALGRLPTGLAFVTALDERGPAGILVNSFTSVSLDPPLVSFCPAKTSFTGGRIRRAGRFGVNVLGAGHAELSRRWARPGADRFTGVDWTAGPGGAPRLREALTFLECTLEQQLAAGDHWIVVGRVEALVSQSGAAPLVLWDGALGTFAA